MVITLCILAVLSFLVGIFFWIKSVREKRRILKERELFQKKTVDEVLSEAQETLKTLDTENPSTLSDVLLVYILNGINKLRGEMRSLETEIRGLSGNLNLIAGILFSVELLILALLWTLR